VGLGLSPSESALAEAVPPQTDPTTTAGPPPLKLSEVLEAVLARHPAVRAAELEVEVALGEVRAALGAFDLAWKSRATRAAPAYYQTTRVDSLLEKPTALWGTQFFVGWRYGQGRFAAYDLKALTGTQGELRAGFEVPLLRNGPIDRRRASLRRAELGEEAARAQSLQTLLETLRGSAHKYWDWYAAARRLEVQRRMLQIAEERDRALTIRVGRGDLAEFERQDNLRTILQRRSAVLAARRELIRHGNELFVFLSGEDTRPAIADLERVPNEAVTLIRPELPGIEALVPQALRQRPELRRLEAQREQNEVEARWAGNQRLPSLNVQVGVSRDLGEREKFLGQTDFESALLLEIPLQNRVAEGRERSARAASERLEQQLRLQKARIEAEIRDSHEAVLLAYERMEIAHREHALARELEKGERDRFESGDSNILTINLREQATADAALREVDSQAECLKSEATLQVALGEFPTDETDQQPKQRPNRSGASRRRGK
jgi:outer membrane protein TolC